MSTAALLVAMATVYAGPYVGQPLYCDQGNGLLYSQATRPWVALDVTEFQSGRVQCGDTVAIHFVDGTILQAQALDAGLLYPHYIADIGLPIAVDLPSHLAPFSGFSARAEIHLPAVHPHLTRE